MASKVFESEYRFCMILWEHEPVSSGELVRLCQEQLNWKKSTTFTVIRRLAERGILQNENTIVTSLVSKEEVQIDNAEEMIEKVFEGSLPLFVNTFVNNHKLTEKELDEIMQIIENYKKDNK